MTDSNYTALLLVIDRSGSMISIRDEMIGGVTALLKTQAKAPGLLTVDVVQFDNEIEQLDTLADPRSIEIALEPRGATALHDAVGIAVTTFGSTLAALPEHARPATVQVVVVTDGHENTSQEWTAATVKKLVRQQTTTYGWDFVYLGANQDAVLTGAALGFASDSSMTFEAGAAGVAAASATVNRYFSDVRGGTRRGFDEGERRASRGS
ncbi:VWA domain containing CoxE-like protein [Frondihabitans sp. PhB188]|uniref:vWA domain-containing protein n=1 Tax=Frondihabitans sp. PhB188 TaxID=2485200 RepID=UPI000F4820CF|nr:vWA domain-containing protein [Frondihabitans sp. PhB188]ROQ40692.1 VWA domain containing CoxE-like protein [Frondihabitans sp. PhB188]